MRVPPFELERWQSEHEHHVEVNLTESGVHPRSLREVGMTSDELRRLLDAQLTYTQTNGTPPLRRRIADLHPGATEAHVQVVNGGSEANFVAVWALLEPGDEVVVQLPTYPQVPGLVEAFGGRVRPWWLTPDFDGGRWRADVDALAAVVTERTKVIALCNPNNPTGSVLDADALDAIVRVAARYDAWILSDEIYRGSELGGADETPTLWGRYPRVAITGSLSKSYGLPGLRLGWVVAPPTFCETLWSHHDYTTIGPGALSDAVATHVLETERRRGWLSRTREHLRVNHRTVERWLDGVEARAIPAQAGAMAYLRYEGEPSRELAERLRTEASVLVVPGAHFDMEGWLRLGVGGTATALEAGLQRLEAVLGAST